MSRTLNKQPPAVDHFVEHAGAYTAEKRHVEIPKLPPGIYKVKTTQSGKLIYVPMQALTDGLIDLPGHQSDTILKEINNFWTPQTRARFSKFGLVFKRGILMYGAPGSGKSVVVAKIMDKVVQEGGIVFFETPPDTLFEAVTEVKAVQGDIKVLAIFEEFDAWVAQSHSMLSLLDGEMQIDNIVFLATTNYIDRIPPRIKNRPSRFATVIEIGAPDEATRRAFLLGKIGPDENVDIENWVKLSKGMMLDHMKDLIISVLCIGVTLEDAIKKLKSMNDGDLREDEDNYIEKDTGPVDEDALLRGVLNDPEDDTMAKLGRYLSRRMPRIK